MLYKCERSVWPLVEIWLRGRHLCLVCEAEVGYCGAEFTTKLNIGVKTPEIVIPRYKLIL